MHLFAHFSRFCAGFGGFMSKNIAIFASGNGTNAENIIRYFQNSESVNVKLVLLIGRLPLFWNVHVD